jgi:hypothetical protein
VLELNAFAMLVAMIPLIDPPSAESPAGGWLRAHPPDRRLQAAASA